MNDATFTILYKSPDSRALEGGLLFLILHQPLPIQLLLIAAFYLSLCFLCSPNGDLYFSLSNRPSLFSVFSFVRKGFLCCPLFLRFHFLLSVAMFSVVFALGSDPYADSLFSISFPLFFSNSFHCSSPLLFIFAF